MAKRNKKARERWFVPAGMEPTELDRRILYWQEKGKLMPTRSLIKTAE